MHYGGMPVLTWKRQRNTFLDQKALKTAHPDIHKEFTRAHHYRVMRVK
jgi:hypothetical protein